SKTLDPDDAFAFALPAGIVDNPQTIDRENTIICGKPGTGVKLPDGSSIVWEGMTNEPMQANTLYALRFAVTGPDGKPAELENYLGMRGHAAIVRNDGNVYMHLHPVGTFSMAAEANLVKRIAEPAGMYIFQEAKKYRDSIDNFIRLLSSLSNRKRDSILMQSAGMQEMKGSMDGMLHDNIVEFPYSFPSPGQYRIWVQFRKNGQIFTGAFDKIVV
ncbi:MAG: hypothetical protein WKF89_04340, partial [Chitinophagaceae bacterium]